MSHLHKNGHNVNLQILDNKCSTTYKLKIEEKWNSTFQLLHPNMHRRNIDELMIQTFNAHFLYILARVSITSPNFLREKLLPKTELTLNLLHQSNIAPSQSAWEHFNGPFNFDVTPLAPLGSPIIIHTKPGTCIPWDFRSRKGFTIGPELEHYRCFQVVDATTKSIIISDTIEVTQEYLTQPEVNLEDRILHTLNFLSCTVKDATITVHHVQLLAISKLRNLFTKWTTTCRSNNVATTKSGPTSKGGTTPKGGSIPNGSTSSPTYCLSPQNINSSK